MNFSCKAIIFDLDGILIDSHHISERHWKLWATRHNIPFEQVVATYHGRPSIETIQLLAPHLDSSKEADFMELAETNDTDGLVVFEGVHSLLARIPANKWAIATSGTRLMAINRIHTLQLRVPRVLITADNVAKGKPDPEPYLLAARQLGMAPSECLVIEDTPVGIASAKAAGTRVIGIASTTSPQKLSQADGIVRCFNDMRLEIHKKDLPKCGERPRTLVLGIDSRAA